jgi:hypothetical protein
MTHSRNRMGRRQRQLSWSLLPLLAVYFLSLCTLNPHVHATTLRQSVQTQHPATGHCARPSAIPQTAAPLPVNHDRPTEPLCCELRGVSNKVTSPFFSQADTSPLSILAVLLPGGETRAEEAQRVHCSQPLHSSRPPPLYLLHTTFLL